MKCANVQLLQLQHLHSNRMYYHRGCLVFHIHQVDRMPMTTEKTNKQKTDNENKSQKKNNKQLIKSTTIKVKVKKLCEMTMTTMMNDDGKKCELKSSKY